MLLDSELYHAVKCSCKLSILFLGAYSSLVHTQLPILASWSILSCPYSFPGPYSLSTQLHTIPHYPFPVFLAALYTLVLLHMPFPHVAGRNDTLGTLETLADRIAFAEAGKLHTKPCVTELAKPSSTDDLRRAPLTNISAKKTQAGQKCVARF